MEDGFPLFDSNDEAARQEQKLLEYYNNFSSDARLRLLSKNIIRPITVYDVLYPATRNASLAKNIPFDNNIEEDAKIIRNKLISKMIHDETKFEKISEDFRKSMLARAKIQDDRGKLMIDIDSFRKSLIAKNSSNGSDLEKDSNAIRNSNISKNKLNPSIQDNIDNNNSTLRNNELSKNTPKNQDLLRDSELIRNEFRKNEVKKNVPNKSNIEKDSNVFRNNNIRKNDNLVKFGDLDKLSTTKRAEDLAKNTPNNSSIENSSIAFRNVDVSKNTPKDQDLLRDSNNLRNQFRKSDVNKNTDIEKDNIEFRRNNLSKNTSIESNIEFDSETYRKSNTSKDVQGQNSANIEEVANEKRVDSISKNVSNNSNLEKDSNSFRDDDLSANISIKSNIDKDSEIYRADDLSANKSKLSNLEMDSVPFRVDDLLANKPKLNDLEEDSVLFRVDDLSLNKLIATDLEVDSVLFRRDDLSLNISNNNNLEKDSTPFRIDDLSANKPKLSNLKDDSLLFREDDLSLNKLIATDLEGDSVLFRKDDLSLNKPKETDLETDSTEFRRDDLAANTPSISDLEIDSIPFREDDLSVNVPSTSDLEIDSIPFRDDDLAANVPSTSDLEDDSIIFRDDDLAANVPSTSDLEDDSIIFRNDDLATNVPINTDLSSDSVQFRDNNVSSNIPHNTDLLSDSQSLRKDAISRNSGFGLIGINVQGAGTSAFLGISRVFTQGILIRQLLFSKNKWKLSKDEYTSTNQNWTLGGIMQGSVNTNIVDYNAIQPHYKSPIRKSIFSTQRYLADVGKKIQDLYGTSQNIKTTHNSLDFNVDIKNSVVTISDALYSVSTTSPKGGGFFSNKTIETKTIGFTPFLEGKITANIRKYNISRNTFSLYGLKDGFKVGDKESLSVLEDSSLLEFQELIALTIGKFRSNSFQDGTLTTPKDILKENDGAYHKGLVNNIDLLRPTIKDSADSMMAKTVVGNPFEDDYFLTGKRGVKHIINTIKNGKSTLSSNFDPQNSKVYVVGRDKDNKNDRTMRQRYTIANPYTPGKAGRLMFSLKNYSSGDQYFFPPYIQSIQNTENANWNSTNFLGRPEAVYTYNTSSRDASISFYVLTDYAQKVEIGRDWNSETTDAVNATTSRHFTQSDYTQNEKRKLNEQRLNKLKEEQLKSLKENNDKLRENSIEAGNIKSQQPVIDTTPPLSLQPQPQPTQPNENFDPTNQQALFNKFSVKVADNKKEEDLKERALKTQEIFNTSEKSTLTDRIKETTTELGKTAKSIGENIINSNKSTNYSESNDVGNNVYNINLTKDEPNNLEKICKPEDTITRIKTMIKGLMFQPAYFSGDKVDFVRKVEFLSKLTRPAAAFEGENAPQTGFSFIKPPVCHIRLGDWWDHDIIVNSVSFDYADAPWTLEGGRVQPMWVLVNISFNIVGSFKSANARPPLSTDKGGMYSPTGGISRA